MVFENYQEKNETPIYNRMPITIEIGGRVENIWTKYQLGREVIAVDCIKCGKKSQEIEIQRPENIKVETDNPEIEKIVTEKLRQLIRTVEERMAVCGECFDDDFLKKRKELYIVILEQVQKEMGMDVNFQEQKEKIYEN